MCATPTLNANQTYNARVLLAKIGPLSVPNVPLLLASVDGPFGMALPVASLLLPGRHVVGLNLRGAIFLFNGIGQDVIIDDYLKPLMKRERPRLPA